MNARRGIEAERRCANDLRDAGYKVTRSAASKGQYDVIAIGPTNILLVQVKRTKEKYRLFSAKDRREIERAVCPETELVRKQLWCWLDGDGWSKREYVNGQWKICGGPAA